MRSLFGTVARSGVMGAAIGLPILGLGGRGLMRVIAHWEGRVPVFTIGGTFTVLFAATMAGLAAGVTHGLLQRFVRNAMIRNAIFAVLSVLFTWRAVNVLLPRPRLMFVALTLIYVLVFELISADKKTSRWSPVFSR